MSFALHPSAPASAELIAEVTGFYAVQMPLLESRDFEGFTATFTEDCVFGYAGAWQLTGRTALMEGMRANMPRYGDSVIRHWFDNRRAVPAPDGSITVTATCLVSVTAPDGSVAFEPSCVVTDELVRQGGSLRTRSRLIAHDLLDPAVYFAPRH